MSNFGNRICIYVVRSIASNLQLRREFRYEPEKCKETDMINYLLDSYDRVGSEERTAPKVYK